MGFGLGANAATYSYEFSTEFSGATAPSGPTPWATLSFADIATGSVLMTLNLSGSSDIGKVTEFDFNYGGGATLAFAHTGGDAATVSPQGSNLYKADGDGFFDIQFLYPNSGSLFQAGDSSIYTITGTGLTAADFNYTSFTGGGNGTWYSALHAQGLGPTGGQSGWIGATPAIPEPETYAMMLAGLGLLGFVARRRRQQGIGNAVPA